MSEQLTYTDTNIWPNERLSRHLAEMEEVNQDWQTEARRIQIKRRVAHIVFEQMQRYRESYVGDALIEDINSIDIIEMEEDVAWGQYD